MNFFNVKNNFTKRLFQLFGITFLFITFSSKAQLTDTLTLKKSSNNQPNETALPIERSIKKIHSPKKAALFSTVLPGLGQAYNKKYWKIPIIYIGFGGLAYFINSNQSKYVRYRDAYKYRIDNDPSTVDNYVGKYSDENLNSLQRYYHRYRDLSVIGAGFLYLLNIVDASVDAHLFRFDVTDDLSFNLHPTLINTASVNHFTTGISFSIKF